MRYLRVKYDAKHESAGHNNELVCQHYCQTVIQEKRKKDIFVGFRQETAVGRGEGEAGIVRTDGQGRESKWCRGGSSGGGDGRRCYDGVRGARRGGGWWCLNGVCGDVGFEGGGGGY